ncbi:hypothetical protein FV222_13340 [Methylobacterium sp. WL103]|uniref:hypothetical protein n=1 Tax=Methylobacterium sp. WL103 TaxID=2603891 RepID=UPI0011CAB0F2|nr:hypothetical protein [Methylobacterium sp. WL103]TXM99216.1 hypothetical protein FV222_13340 [Methylobacterium sp. WL103]
MQREYDPRRNGPITRQMSKPAKMAIELPYGRWTCRDGREVLFNRYYVPTWQRRPGEAPTPADPDERVLFEEQDWFWTGGDNAPWRRARTLARCEAALSAWGLPTDMFELSRQRFAAAYVAAHVVPTLRFKYGF